MDRSLLLEPSMSRRIWRMWLK